jgi:hypothetical protein
MNEFHASRRRPLARALQLSLIASAAWLVGCGGGDDATAEPEETRPHNARTFTADTAATTFPAMAAATGDAVAMSSTSRWAGVLGGAGYHVEVPAVWNGKLVMYAHGYAGTGAALGVQDPSIRRYLIQNGYAWAASSYSKNYYDVRAGVEDTNALALEFVAIAGRNGRTLAAPSKTYITGHSMGGHITGAAIEDETVATSVNKVRYAGAVPMCGVMGDTDLASYFGGAQVAAQAVAGVPGYPFTRFADINNLVASTLFTTATGVPATAPTGTPTAAGLKFLSALKSISGGERPMFQQGWSFGGTLGAPWGFFGSDGTFTGILTKNVVDTTGWLFAIEGDAVGSTALNAAVLRITPEPDANRLRRDGLRWIPKVNGEFKIPVVSIHTLGDLFVPFSMQQIYQKRVAAKGNSAWLVQRAIRGASHCDFTVAEQAAAFDDMIKWERDGIKPTGDDVVTPATVAAPTYGCTYTRNTLGADDSANTRALRGGIAATSPACP